MKEILKYLRQTNNFTQEEIARRLEISRQSYIKYENGEVEPGDKVIRTLSIIYGVREEFIRRNEVPKPGIGQTSKYSFNRDSGSAWISENSVGYGTKVKRESQIFEGIYDGSVIRLLNSLDGFNIKKGQKFKLYIEEIDEKEERERKMRAFDELMKLVRQTKPCTLSSDEDPYYKEMITNSIIEAYEEKNGHAEHID